MKETLNPSVENKSPIPEKLNLALGMDKIPVATPEMTERELRDIIVDFMYLQINFAYTPDFGDKTEYKYYIKNKRKSYGFEGCQNPFEKGKYYGGIPYVGNAAGSLYRWLEFYDAETGVMNWDPIIRTARKDWVDEDTEISYPDVGSAIFCNSCAAACIWSFLRVTSKIKTIWTSTWTPQNGFVKVGDYDLTERGTHGKSTKELCEANGKERMFAAYSKIKKADGIVKTGHAALCVADAVTVRDENGNIDGEASYILFGEQTGEFLTTSPAKGGVFLYSPLNDKGDTYRIQGNFAGNTVNGEFKEMKFSFERLFEKGFLPFTIPELCGQGAVEKTEIGLYEEDEVYSAEQIKAGDLKKMTVKSNYVISDIHFIIRDGEGGEVFRAMHAELAIDIDQLKSCSVGKALLDNEIYKDKEYINANVLKYAAKGDHTLEITARVSTGELLTVYKGKLTK